MALPALAAGRSFSTLAAAEGAAYEGNLIGSGQAMYFTEIDTAVTPSDPDSGISSLRVAVGDFNGDGFIDAIVTRLNGNQPFGVNYPEPIQILLGDGLGGFTDGSATLFPGGAPLTVGAGSFSVADFNGDGRDDIFFADFGADALPFPGYHNTLVLSSGLSGLIDGTATHLPAQTDAVNLSSIVGDIDGDLDIDIVVNHGFQAYVLINSGDGHFTADATRMPEHTAIGTGEPWLSNDIADMDNDGDLDLILSGWGGNDDSRIYWNDGDGFFLTRTTLPAPPYANELVDALITIDLNGDGRLDVIQSVHDGSYDFSKFQIFIQQPDHSFLDQTLAHMVSADSAGAGGAAHKYDINGDGQEDLLFWMIHVDGNKNGMLFLMRDGDQLVPIVGGVFDESAHDNFSAPFDADGDGLLDLLVPGTAGQFHARFELSGVEAVQTGDGDANGLMGGVEANVLTGLGGDDTLFASDGDDTLNGGEGRDVLFGGKNADILIGGADDDYLNGGAGVDTARYEESAAGVYVSLAAGAGYSGDALNDTLISIENLVGSDHADTMVGDAGANALSGESGVDILYGQDGDDDIHGGDGGDTLWGEAGADSMSGGDGDDTIFADAADTLVAGNAGFDYVYFTGAGSLSIDAGANGVEWIYASDNTDILLADAQTQGVIFYGLGGGDIMTGGAGIDTLYGGEGNDSLIGGALGDALWGEGGADALLGGDGDDTLICDVLDTQVSGGAGYDYVYFTGAGNFIINAGTFGLEWIFANEGNDNLNAATQTQGVIFYGLGGADTLTGGAGIDTLFGGNGNDTLVGGALGDSLWGEGGADSISGGDGNDTIFADSLDTLVSGDAGQDFLYILGDSDFVIDAGANGIEWMLSGGGNDTLNAASQSANVVAYGGGGADTISGGSGTDVLFGQGGADDIHGGGDGDVLLGEAGADTLNGGLGNDLMFGGADADAFAFEAGWGFDTVGDFENGSDLFDMTALAGEGVNDFGDLTIGTSGADALISWNGNFITVSNAAGVIDASDFLFG